MWNPLISFLNLEKYNGTQSQICKVVVNDQEASDPTDPTFSKMINLILNIILNFYKSFKNGKSPSQINDFLGKVQLKN